MILHHFANELSTFLVLFGLQPRAKAQEIESPKIELYGGRDYVRYNANPRIKGVPPYESFGASGITGQAAYNPDSRSGIVGELSGYSLARTGRNTTYQVSYLLGPRVSLRHHIITHFAQALFGGVGAADGAILGPVTAFGMTAREGVGLRVSRFFAIRPVQTEYLMTKFPESANNRQSNFRYGAGIVLRLGKK